MLTNSYDLWRVYVYSQFKDEAPHLREREAGHVHEQVITTARDGGPEVINST